MLRVGYMREMHDLSRTGIPIVLDHADFFPEKEAGPMALPAQSTASGGSYSITYNTGQTKYRRHHLTFP
jgi:hypothetical protein